jgi:hypothetical protein
MNTESIEKSKRGDQPIPYHHMAEFKLGAAVVLCFIFWIAITSTVDYPFNCLTDIFYPTLFFSYDVGLRLTAWIGIIAACVWLFRRARRQRVQMAALVFAGLACTGLLLKSLDSTPFTRLRLNTSYEIDGTQYRLMYFVGNGSEIDLYGPVRSFVLFRCEGPGGMRCDTVGTADITFGEALMLDDSRLDQVRLDTEVTQDAVMLDIGTESPRAFIGCMLR